MIVLILYDRNKKKWLLSLYIVRINNNDFKSIFAWIFDESSTMFAPSYPNERQKQALVRTN